MATTFHFELLSLGKQIAEKAVSEVVLPAHDGEVGILAGHEDFIGLLGTGALKAVRDGNDYWYLVSAGVYQVRDGKLTVLAEVVEESSDIDVEETKRELESIAAEMVRLNLESLEARRSLRTYQQLKARMEVHRRTEVVN